MFMQALLWFSILSIVEGTVYLYDTEDSLPLEVYHCIHHNNLLYCRRPLHPITLQWENETWQCYHNGALHSFNSLWKQILMQVLFWIHGDQVLKRKTNTRIIEDSRQNRSIKVNIICVNVIIHNHSVNIANISYQLAQILKKHSIGK